MAEENTNDKKAETKITKDFLDVFENKDLFIFSNYLRQLVITTYLPCLLRKIIVTNSVSGSKTKKKIQ